MPDAVIYFVSDTHLGDGSAADRFRYPNELLALLDRIAAEPAAHLVLLGDFLELWATSLEAILVHHAPIIKSVARITRIHPVTYVVGNHDCLPWYYYLGISLGNLTITEEFTAARGGLMAIHGHQFDPFNQVKVKDDGEVKAPWTRKLVQILGAVTRVGGPVAGEAIANAGELITKHTVEHQSPGERGYPLGELIYDDAARNLMRQGARFVVMGHTHHPLTRSYGARTYVNTGSWVWDRYPPTYARFSQGRLELLNAQTHQPYVPAPPEQ